MLDSKRRGGNVPNRAALLVIFGLWLLLATQYGGAGLESSVVR